MKKAQGLTLNTMVMAVLAIIVLAIGIALFYSFVNNTAEPGITGPVKCGTLFGGKSECLLAENCKAEGGTSVGKRGCEDEKVCCVG